MENNLDILEAKTLQSLVEMLRRTDSPIFKLIEAFVDKNIRMMFINHESDLKLICDINQEEAIIKFNNKPFFSAFRTLNLTTTNKYINSPILIFFSVFKSWFFHHMLYLAKNLEMVDQSSDEAKFLKSNNLLSIWNCKILKNEENYEKYEYSANDGYVEYDLFLKPNGEIKKELSKIIELLYETFIQNNPILLINQIKSLAPTWIKNGQNIIIYKKSVQEDKNLTQRYLLYLDLIDEILFEKEPRLNYNFKLFFSLQGILITLNTFMKLSEDIENVNLFNILNKQFVSELKDLNKDDGYLDLIRETLTNFFVEDDMRNETTRHTTNHLLSIFCSIFNVRLLYSCYPFLTKGNDGSVKNKLILKRIYPAFELMNHCKLNIVKSVNIKVMLYLNFDHGNLFYLYNHEEILNFNLQY